MYSYTTETAPGCTTAPEPDTAWKVGVCHVISQQIDDVNARTSCLYQCAGQADVYISFARSMRGVGVCDVNFLP